MVGTRERDGGAGVGANGGSGGGKAGAGRGGKRGSRGAGRGDNTPSQTPVQGKLSNACMSCCVILTTYSKPACIGALTLYQSICGSVQVKHMLTIQRGAVPWLHWYTHM